MADKDREVEQDPTGAPEPVVATGGQVPDVPQDVSSQQPEGTDDATAGTPDDTDAAAEPDVAAHLVDADAPDTEADADAPDTEADADEQDRAELAADDAMDADEGFEADTAADVEADEPAWFVGEPEPIPGLTVPVPTAAHDVPDVPDVPDVVTLPDAADDDPPPAPEPAPEPAWRDEPPIAVQLGPLEPETTALTLRPPAELLREHRRRERRRTLTFLGIFLGVLGMGAASFTFFQGRWTWPFGGQTVAAPICPTPTSTAFAPADVSVKVYNAGTRKGLAKSVAGTMRKRGFLVGEVGNDPQEASVKGAAIVRHGPDGLEAARTVAAQVDGKVEFVDDGRVSQSVDLVLGTKWTKFRSVAAANKVLAPPAPAGPAGCVPASPEEGATPTGTPSGDPTPSAT